MKLVLSQVGHGGKVSESSSSRSMCPFSHMYLPLPGFSPVVGIISPLSNFYKSNNILAERGKNINTDLILKHFKVNFRLEKQ